MNDNQNLIRNLSMQYHENIFSQHQGQSPDRAQSLMEPPQMERKRGKKDINLFGKVNLFRENSEKEKSDSEEWKIKITR